MSNYRPYPTHREDDPNYGNLRYGFGPSTPLGVIFFMTTLFVWACSIAPQFLEHHGRVDSSDLVLRTIVAIGFGGILTAGNVNERRRAGGIGAIRTVRTAMKTEALPASADSRIWQPALEYRERQLLQGRWLTPLILIGAAAVVVVLTCAEHQALLGLWIATLCAAGVVWEELRIARELPRTRTLLQHLKTLTTAA